jgi:hypothetical protein
MDFSIQARRVGKQLLVADLIALGGAIDRMQTRRMFALFLDLILVAPDG